MMLVLATTPFSLPAAAKDEAKTSGWELLATSFFAGRYKAYMTESRAEFDNGVVKFYITPPDYTRLTIVNAEEKKFLDVKIEDWLKQNVGAAPAFDKWNFKYVGDAVIEGLKCRHYQSHYGRVEANYYSTSMIAAKKELANACCRFACVPVGYGVPIRFQAALLARVTNPSKTRLIKGATPILDVLHVRRIPLAASDFVTAPSGYKKTSDPAELYLGSDLESMFQQPLGKSSKH